MIQDTFCDIVMLTLAIIANVFTISALVTQKYYPPPSTLNNILLVLLIFGFTVVSGGLVTELCEPVESRSERGGKV